MKSSLIIISLVSLCASGCAHRTFSSKWAKDNPDYAAKYDKPYSKDEAKRYGRMAKQMVDARHVEGMTGGYLGFAAQDDPATLGAEIGVIDYPTSWLEGHIALSGLVGANTDSALAGLNAGARVSSPSRIAPFVGVGAYGGFNQYEIDADSDGLDNNQNLIIDEPGETIDDCDILLALYPEVGVHFWLRHNLRLTGSAAYYVTTEGRNQDFWLLGVSIARFRDVPPPYVPQFVEEHDSADEVVRLPAP